MPLANRRRRRLNDRQRRDVSDFVQDRRRVASERREKQARIAAQRRQEQARIDAEARAERARVAAQRRQERTAAAEQRRQELAQARQIDAISDPSCAARFETKVNSLSFEECNVCNQRFFDLNTIDDICKRCRQYAQNGELNPFSHQNDMQPGDIPPEMSILTFVEQAAISRVQAMVFVYKLKFGQMGYSGQVISFPQDVNSLANSLPLLIDDIF